MWISVTASITRVERQRAEELAQDDLEVGERRGEQQLDRARALLLRVGPHRDHRQQEQQQDRDVLQQRPDQLLVDVHRLPAPPIWLICMLWRTKKLQDRDEEVAEEQREEADHDVGDRRGEVRPQLLAARSRGCYSWAASSCRRSPRWPPAARLVGRERQEDVFEAHAHRPQLEQAPAARRRRRAPDRGGRRGRVSLSTSKPTTPSRRSASATRVTPATRAERAGRVGAARVDLHVQRLRAAQPRRQVVGRVDGDDRPLLMMTTRWQVCETSGRMCVLRMMVWSPASSLISWRVSMICFGIEAGGRLVEDQHVGVVDERLRQADALPVALRQLGAEAVRHVGDPRALHHRLTRCAPLGRRARP